MTRRNQRVQRSPQPRRLTRLVGLGLLGFMVAAQTVATPVFAQNGAQQEGAIVPVIINLSPDLPLLKLGDEGDEVKQLQTVLAQLDWYQNPIHGRYDPPTEQAVRAFQQQEGLVADGVTGTATWQRLALNLSPQSVFDQIPMLGIHSLVFTPLMVAQPDPPPSPLWLLLMAMIPLVGGGLTYLHHQYQNPRKY